MSKLFTLGCSLTYPYGWKNILADQIGFELVDSAMYASSNSLQVRRMHSYIARDLISPNDIIVWQVTSQGRHSFSVAPSEEWQHKLEISKPAPVDERFADTEYYVNSPINFFDGMQHIDILSNHPMITQASNYYDFNQSTEELLSVLTLLNNKYRVLVFVGWQGALDQVTPNYQKFLDALAAKDIPHMPENMIDWVIKSRNKLDLEDPQGLHPTLEASENYARKALYPKLQELGWV